MSSPPSNSDIRAWLDNGEFQTLFNQLGWDRPGGGEDPIATDDGNITARLVGIKRGVGAWHVTGATNKTDGIAIARKVRQRTRFRLLACEMPDGKQLWLWPDLARSGSGERFIDYEYTPDTQNDHLIQRLQQVEFSLAEESEITAPMVIGRLRSAFDKQKLTNSFFREYKKRQQALAKSVKGLESEDDRHWYSSILLNRLMFIYFIQQKGFLNGDLSYLRSQLQKSKDKKGNNKYFRQVLLPLFHTGLGAPVADADDKTTRAFLGTIPYVNGDVFSEHELELDNPKLDIPDKACEDVLTFLDKYRWHLDERPTGEANEIRPDVLGFIFEQYVNQKESGAYYTPEDVTHYMSSVTVLPALLDRLDTSDVVNERIRDLLAADPDRYIWPAVSHGYHDPDRPCERLPYPDHVTAGLDNISKRTRWNEAATATLGHPRESWREVVHRHRRYEEVREILTTGQITDELMPVNSFDRPPPRQKSGGDNSPAGRLLVIDDLISLNLDIPTLVDDYLSSLDLDQLQHAWGTLTSLTVLDPTGGSGAFLLAALELLADCYTAVYQRAEDELQRAHRLGDSLPTPDFVAEARTYANARYFILKSAMLKNLYSLDIMREAGEIARLRMYLKLAAQIDDAHDLEPLPDLEFNIRTGNLLVGIAHEADYHARFSDELFGIQHSAELTRQLQRVLEAEATWRSLELGTRTANDNATQYQHDRKILTVAKDEYRELQASIADVLDRINWAARESMEVPTNITPAIENWKETHQPFHWLCQFPQVFADGGFSIVIGNPPYIGARKVTQYDWQGFATDNAPDIYAICLERTLALLGPTGRLGYITPLSVSFSSRSGIRLVRKRCEDELSALWVSSFSHNGRGSGLFSGVGVQNSIVVGVRQAGTGHGTEGTSLHTTQCHLWSQIGRSHLFYGIEYCAGVERLKSEQWPFVATRQHLEALLSMLRRCEAGTLRQLEHSTTSAHDPTASILYYKRTASFFLQALSKTPPTYDHTGAEIAASGFSSLHFLTNFERDAAILLLNGTFGFSWWLTFSDHFDVIRSVLVSVPSNLKALESPDTDACTLQLSLEFQHACELNLRFMRKVSKNVGRFDINSAEVQAVLHQADEMLADAWDLREELEALRHVKACRQDPETRNGQVEPRVDENNV